MQMGRCEDGSVEVSSGSRERWKRSDISPHLPRHGPHVGTPVPLDLSHVRHPTNTKPEIPEKPVDTHGESPWKPQ